MDRDSIQANRDQLSLLIIQLKQEQQAAGVTEKNIHSNIINDSEQVWDDLMDESIASILPEYNLASSNTPASSQSRNKSTSLTGPVPIENHIIALPSNGNINNDL
jgi:hypothetical protein